MKTNDLFDAAVAAVRDEPIDAKSFDAARDRVRARLAADAAVSMNEAAEVAAPVAMNEAAEHRIQGCEGFRALLPAYLAGALAEPKRVLVEDHTRECVGCRKALQTLRRGATHQIDNTPVRRASRFSSSRTPAVTRWAIAAGLAGLAVVSGAVLYRAGLFAPTPSAVRASRSVAEPRAIASPCWAAVRRARISSASPGRSRASAISRASWSSNSSRRDTSRGSSAAASSSARFSRQRSTAAAIRTRRSS